MRIDLGCSDKVVYQMLAWKYLIVEEMKAHIQFQKYTVTAAVHRIPV